MDVENENPTRGVSTILVACVLILLAGGLVAQIVLASSAASDTDDLAVKKTLARLAWLALVMLAINVVISFWLVLRVLFARNRRVHIGGSTPYVDAWSAAGERFRLDDSDEEDEDEA